MAYPCHGYHPYLQPPMYSFSMQQRMWLNLMEEKSPLQTPHSPHSPHSPGSLSPAHALVMFAEQSAAAAQQLEGKFSLPASPLEQHVHPIFKVVSPPVTTKREPVENVALRKRPKRNVQSRYTSTPPNVPSLTLPAKLGLNLSKGHASCPICGENVQLSELSSHYESELSSVKEIKDISHPLAGVKHSLAQNRERRKTTKVQTEITRKNALSKVRMNRQSRGTSGQANRSGTGHTDSSSGSSTSCHATTSSADTNSEETSVKCPVCSESLQGNSTQINDHVEQCLAEQASPSTSRNASSGDDDEDFETYTWCGQTRVRATTMLDQDSLAASGFDPIRKSSPEDDGDLVVDGDEGEKFGKSQYSEADVIPCTSDEPSEEKARAALRGAVLGTRISPRKAHLQKNNGKTSCSTKWTDGDSTEEGGNSEDIPKCLICMDKYTKPVVSTQCWHVHCEECWLRTLGAKKLCPQCNLITSPNDLRRIYI